ncbi:hypothetical protein GCM10009646_01340 [Streptomyces aureus]
MAGARERFPEDFATLPASARRIYDPEPVTPARSRALEELTARVRADIKARPGPEHRVMASGPVAFRAPRALGAHTVSSPGAVEGSLGSSRGPMASGTSAVPRP